MTRKRPVSQLNKDTGEIIKEYSHMAEANLAMGVCPRQNEIRRCCKGKKDSDFGFKWKFKDDYEKEQRKKINIFRMMIFKSLFLTLYQTE